MQELVNKSEKTFSKIKKNKVSQIIPNLPAKRGNDYAFWVCQVGYSLITFEQ